MACSRARSLVALGLGSALGLGLGCARSRAATRSLEVSASPPPPVWAERGTLAEGGAEFRDATWLDPLAYQDLKIGVAYGPSRASEAERVAEVFAELEIPLHDSWSVDARTWFEDGPSTCHDRIVWYSERAADLAAPLQTRMPLALVVEHDQDSTYDIIVQLCPQ